MPNIEAELERRTNTRQGLLVTSPSLSLLFKFWTVCKGTRKLHFATEIWRIIKSEIIKGKDAQELHFPDQIRALCKTAQLTCQLIKISAADPEQLDQIIT